MVDLKHRINIPPLKLAYIIVDYVNDVKEYKSGISNLELQYLMYIIVCCFKSRYNTDLVIDFEVWVSEDAKERKPAYILNKETYKYFRNYGANSISKDVFDFKEFSGSFTEYIEGNSLMFLYNIIDRWYNNKPHMYWDAMAIVLGKDKHSKLYNLVNCTNSNKIPILEMFIDNEASRVSEEFFNVTSNNLDNAS